MKTPTLIVRLVGLYLIAQNTSTLIQAAKINSWGIGLAQQQIVGDVRIYAVFVLLVGLAAVIFAGRLARILTFDADRD
ncbi:MAG: hypothetical protein Q8J74_08195 [Candidatus Didemnitutus sp.]|nr:hypothetical protein [Candidatus Didemnitutus sp.]